LNPISRETRYERCHTARRPAATRRDLERKPGDAYHPPRVRGLTAEQRQQHETTCDAFREGFECPGVERMPIKYRIEVSLRTVFTTPFGAYTDQDARQHVEDLRNEPDFEADFDQLFDARGVTSVELTGACVREIASIRMFGEGSRRAFATGTDVAFGLTRMFEMLRDDSPDEIRIFRNIDDARRWLGLPARPAG